MAKLPQHPDPYGILLLHASAVQTKKGALIFLGPSGTGKSTVCLRLHPYVSPLADDKIHLVPQNGHWLVSDATKRNFQRALFSFEAKALKGVPLRAVFRLYQDSKSSVERLMPHQTCFHLANSFFDLFWQQNWEVSYKKSVFTNLGNIARVIPGYSIRFNLSTDIRNLIATVDLL